MNYPNDHAFTRITEFKHLTGQEHPKTSIVYEYPHDRWRSVLSDSSPRKRGSLPAIPGTAAEQAGVHFVGRLATYKYYNMDQIVAQALTLYARLCNVDRAEPRLISIPSQS